MDLRSPMKLLFVIWLVLATYIEFVTCQVSGMVPSLTANCSGYAIDRFHQDLPNPSTRVFINDVYFLLPNSSSLTNLNENRQSSIRSIVWDGNITFTDISAISVSVLPVTLSSLRLEVYRDSESAININEKVQCGLRGCSTDKSVVSSVRIGSDERFDVPSSFASRRKTDAVVECLTEGRATIRIDLKCWVLSELPTMFPFVSFIFIKECPAPAVESVSSNAQSVGIGIAVGFVALIVIIIIFIVRSPACHFTGARALDDPQAGAVQKGVSTTTTSATLVSASPQGSDHHQGNNNTVDNLSSTDVHIRNNTDRRSLSVAFTVSEHNQPQLHPGSLSRGSDGTDSNSISFYEKSSIGHIDWQNYEQVEEITLQPDHIALGEVIHSSVSVQIMTGCVCVCFICIQAYLCK
eukprot:scpid51083/ scgid5828/ 